ncbi:ribulose-phosphate 3-epimerase [Spiroplasma endosymbiont of Amphibalanus improvisus]|uniref:ribulose-phosphate 3-epimerase n=1 Tax=Spiroplasma endosymbiont of Amphibalanus improvisus TaxID=3066327 RepID=UPI00313F2BA1
MSTNFKIAASILNANFWNLSKNILDLKKSNIDWIHFDVMDGFFVPNLSFGSKILSDITEQIDYFIDCHMMVKIQATQSLSEYLKPFVDAGANSITLHYEALDDFQFDEFLSFCDKNKIQKGISIKLNTRVSDIQHLLEKIDLILVMGVEPGFGGQKFNNSALQSIQELSKLRKDNNYSYLIQVDGGIKEDNAQICLEKGADILVVGSFLFQDSVDKQVKKIKNQ